MGVVMKCVFSDAIEPEVKQRLLGDAQNHWPFIRLLQQDELPGHAHFATPDMLRYRCGETERERFKQFEAEAASWSRRFPAQKFAVIYIECGGGNCEYSGLVVQNGEILFEQELVEHGHRSLLDNVGIALSNDYFSPFVRGYFV